MGDKTCDLSIIGGGPAGYVAALRAARLGKSVILFERDRVGGTCLNVGCIPTKYLVEKARVLDRIRDLSAERVLDGGGKYSLRRIQEGKRRTVDTLMSGVLALLKSAKVTVVTGEAALTSPTVVECGGVRYQSRNALIATGSCPSLPRIPGLEGNVIDSSEALSLEHAPATMVVIGGGVIGLEFASIFRSFGSEVTVLEILDEILPREDRNAVKELIGILRRRGIRIITGAHDLRIEAGGCRKLLRYRCAEGEESVSGERILAATGRRPSLRGIDAAGLGIRLDARGYVHADRNMRTSVDRVYAAGDITGGWQLAHAAYHEAETAVRAMFGGKPLPGDDLMPRCIYTLPPMAAVGITTQDAVDAGREVAIGSFSYAANGMALAEGAHNGTAWVIADKRTGSILGVHIVGNDSPELIATGAMAIAAGVTAEQWAGMIVAHPTLSEILHEAAMASAGCALHMSR